MVQKLVETRVRCQAARGSLGVKTQSVFSSRESLSTFSYFLFVTFSGLPPRSVQLLVGLPGEAEVVAASVGNIVGDSRDLTDDDEVVSLGFVINSPVKREGVDEVVVDTPRLRAIHTGELHHGGDGSLAILTHAT